MPDEPTTTAACPSWHYLPGPYDASDCPNATTHKALRVAMKVVPLPCPACSGPVRETVGMVCQTCGTDYAQSARKSEGPK